MKTTMLCVQLNLLNWLLIMLVTMETTARSTFNGRQRSSRAMTSSEDGKEEAVVFAVFETMDKETGHLVEDLEPVSPDAVLSEPNDVESIQLRMPAEMQLGTEKTAMRSLEGRRRQQRSLSLDQGGKLKRQRRSSMGWIQAAVRMCDTGRSTDRRCRRIDVNDGRLRLSIRLEER